MSMLFLNVYLSLCSFVYMIDIFLLLEY